MKKTLKRFFATLMVVAMVLTAAPLNGFANLKLNINLDWLKLDWLDFSPKASAAVYSGKCGSNLVYYQDMNTGILTIKGTGAMYDAPEVYSLFYSQYAIEKIVIDEGVTTIGDYAFIDCNNLTSVHLPNSLTKIGVWAFAYCEKLKDIVLPENLKSIGNFAFCNCTSLINIVIPNDVTTIEASTFEYCTSLENITLGDSVSRIEYDAFLGCENLVNVNVSSIDVWVQLEMVDDYYASNPFEYARNLCINNKVVTDIVIPSNIKSIKSRLFWNIKSIKSISIPDSVETIESYAFYGCDNLTKVNIQSIEAWCNVSLFDNSFETPYDLYLDNVLITELIVPESVEKIKCNAFFNCKSIIDLYISNSVTFIENRAFENCQGIKNVSIPTSLKKIGNGAFSGCSSLCDVYYQGCKEEWKKITIEDNNYDLRLADIHYNSTGKDPLGVISVTYDDSADIRKTFNVTVNGTPDQIRVVFPDGGTSSYLRNSDSVKKIVATEKGEVWSIDMSLTKGTYSIKAKYGDNWSELTVFTVKLIGKIIDVYYLDSASTRKVFEFAVTGTPDQIRIIYPDGGTSSYFRDNNKIKITSTEYGEIWSIEMNLPKGNYQVKAKYDGVWSEMNNFVVYLIGKVAEVEYDATVSGKRDYSFTVSGRPEWVQVVYPDGGTTTLKRDDGNVKIKNTFDGEIWTASLTLVDGKYKAKAKYSGMWSDTTNFTVKTQETHKHSYKSVVTAPTCTEKGYTTHTCSACGDNYKDTYVNATGHKEGEWKVTKPATTTSTGTKTLYCSVCGAVIRTETIPKLDPSKGKVKSVSIGDVELNYKGSAKLDPVIEADSGVKYTVTYKSSDSKIATVDNNGNVKGTKDWISKSATITCTVTDEFGNVVTDTCKVTCGYAWWQWIVGTILFGFLWY